MRPIFVLLIVAFSFSCNKHNYLPSSKEILADEILKNSAIKLRKEKDLRLIGTGGGMMNEVRMLALSFFYYGEVDVKKGRCLLISAVNELVDEVNADERIRPYLVQYPFKPENIEIRIFLRKLDGSELDSGKLHVLVAINNILEYEIRDPATDRLKTVYEETYEVALTKLNETSLQQSSPLGEYK